MSTGDSFDKSNNTINYNKGYEPHIWHGLHLYFSNGEYFPQIQSSYNAGFDYGGYHIVNFSYRNNFIMGDFNGDGLTDAFTTFDGENAQGAPSTHPQYWAGYELLRSNGKTFITGATGNQPEGRPAVVSITETTRTILRIAGYFSLMVSIFRKGPCLLAM